MKKLKVFLADLRHVRDGVLFADTMPLGIGYMKAVIDRDLSDKVDCQIFAYPNVFHSAVVNENPDVVMVSNYMWNEALSLWYLRKVKEQNPNALTVMGGPNIAIEEERQIKFLEDNPQIDIYALGEGDFFARDILELFIEHDANIDKLKDSNLLSHCVYRSSTGIQIGDSNPRSKELAEIPSPWLNGIMDKFFDNKLSPLYETNRGCPFTCTFCVQGTRYYTKVSHFGLNRVREELFYIADRIKTHSPNVKILRIADPNFGMYERDVEISRYMGETQNLYDYPMFIDATTGKNKPERIIKAMEQVSGAMIMWQSVQSLDDSVLTNVKRKNIKLSTYNDINVYLKGRGLRSQADLILCLPGESLESHRKALEGLTNSGVLRFNNFQAMLLKGSEMETVESRQKYGFEAKHRLIQKNFSIHKEEKVFETEEIIVSTDTFSFEEYIIARKFHLIINLFLNELRFEKLLHLFDSQGIPRWTWIEKMYEMIDDDSFIKQVFDQFASDTENELFDSVEELTRFYSHPDNYEKLERGEIGDNVIHKYRVISNYYNWKDICDFAYRAAYELINELNGALSNADGFDLFWNDLKAYQYHSSANGRTRDEILSDSKATFSYDIQQWMDGDMENELDKYRVEHSVRYNFSLSDSNKKNLEASLNRWNTDLVGMSLMIRKIKQHWLEKKPSVVLVDVHPNDNVPELVG